MYRRRNNINRMYDENYFPSHTKVEFIRKRGPVYNSVPLDRENYTYRTVENRMNVEDIEILSIHEIDNQFVENSYELKKQQKKLRSPFLYELRLFHGTTMKNAKNICRVNFDWRKCGSRSGNCYNGQGVYFSPDDSISKRYPKKTKGYRYSISSKVLFESCAIGNQTMKLPPPGTDTTVSRNFKEIVKYEDNEFCPTHIIVFKSKPTDHEEFYIHGMKMQKECDFGATKQGGIVRSKPINRVAASVDATYFDHDESFLTVDGINIKKVDGFSVKKRVVPHMRYESMPFSREDYRRWNLSFDEETVFNSFPQSSSLDEEEDLYSECSEASSDEDFDDWVVKIEHQKRTTMLVQVENPYGFIMKYMSDCLKFIWKRIIIAPFVDNSDFTESDSSEK